jgi:hypothetical protein
VGAEATLRSYLEGLKDDRLQDQEQWAKDFFLAWDEWVYKLAAIAKDIKWKTENEFRLVHELKVEEFGAVRFQQKETMLARYLPLTTPAWTKWRTPILPIARITIGPGNHSAFTKVSVRLLLEQMGYFNIPSDVTRVAFQRP